MSNVSCVFIENIYLDEGSTDWCGKNTTNLVVQANDKVDSSVEVETVNGSLPSTERLCDIFPASVVIVRSREIMGNISGIKKVFEGNEIPPDTRFIVLKMPSNRGGGKPITDDSVKNEIKRKLDIPADIARTTEDVVRALKTHLLQFDPTTQVGRKNIRRYGEDIDNLFEGTSENYDVIPDDIKDEDEDKDEDKSKGDNE